MIEAVDYGFSEEKTSGFNSIAGGRRHGSDHSALHVMILLLTIFLVIRMLEFVGQLPPLAASFADDLLCLPLVLGGILWCHRRLARQGDDYTLPRSHGLLTLALFAVYFEGLLPHWTSAAVRDPRDLLMYLAGYLVFEILMNRPARKIRRNCCQESV